MGEVTKEKDDLALYIKDQEYIANNYVMKCFTVTMWVYTTAFVLNLLTFGKAIPKKDAKQLKNVQLTDMIFSAFHSILDGSIEKHEVGSPYYNVFTSALSLPLRIVKKLRIKNKNIIRILTHISNASHEIMTGGDIDSYNAFLEF